MALSPKIKVNPEILKWARETVGESVSAVAKRLGVKEAKVIDWEAGKDLLTYRKLESLADFYKRPVAAFFLPSVPAVNPIPVDFRTPNRDNLNISKEIRLSIRHARYIRNIYSDINPDHKILQLKKVSISDDIESLAKRERSNLKISFEIQKRWPVKEAYQNWIKLVEDAGILVLQKSLPAQEMNGFSLTEEGNIPVIVINSRDVPARKTFTLFHEYAHLLLHKGGICKLQSSTENIERDDNIEAFCDRFAASFLVPKDLFFEQPELSHLDLNHSDSAVKSLAQKFKVSRQVILLRLLLAGRIRLDTYREYKAIYDAEFEQYLKIKKAKEKQSKGGPPPHIMSVSENGKLYTRTVIQAFHDGRLSKKEISSYTGVRLKHIPAIESLL